MKETKQISVISISSAYSGMKVLVHISISMFQKCAAWTFPELCIRP